MATRRCRRLLMALEPVRRPSGRRLQFAILSKGYRLYDTYCASCHGDDGNGVHPEDLLEPAMVAPPIGAETVARLGSQATRAKALHMLRRESGACRTSATRSPRKSCWT